MNSTEKKLGKSITLGKGFDLISFQFYSIRHTPTYCSRWCEITKNDRVVYTDATSQLGTRILKEHRADGWIDA